MKERSIGTTWFSDRFHLSEIHVRVSFWCQIRMSMGSPIKRHPLKGTCQEKKVVRKQEEAFF
jgi:hypothetical protein